MDSSSGSNNQHQPSSEMLPPRPIKRKLDDRQPLELSLFSSNASHTPEEPRSKFDQTHESPTACASPQQIINATVTKKRRENEKAGNDFPKHLGNMTLQAIAEDSVDTISAKMRYSTNDSQVNNMVKELMVILEGKDDSQKKEYLMLQNLVQSRTDLTAVTLNGAHRLQLQILVAIKTGSPAFLQNRTSVLFSLNSLIEIFEQKRCRNAECQTLLPANKCVCKICTNKKGFCNLCMCVICNKYEFEMVMCPSSSNMCSHKVHRDCVMANGLIDKSKAHQSKMAFGCQDCSKQIDLIMKCCCKDWDREALIRDFDLSGILHGSDNPGQRELFRKCEDLQEPSMDAPKSVENGEGGKLIAPQEASNQIAEVEGKTKMYMPFSFEAEAIEEGKTSGQTEVKAPNNPDGVQEVPPLEQLVDADGAQPELATRDAGPSSPNSSSNLRPSTLLHKFPPVPSDVHLFNNTNMCIPNNLPFTGTYSSSNGTVEATTPDLAQILAAFFRKYPTVQTHIESFSKVIQNNLSERLVTLLHHLHFVSVRDFDEAARAKVQEAWNDLTRAGCELQDLEPAVNQALRAKEELTTKILALERDIQAHRDKLDKPPLHNSDDHFL